MCCRAQAPQEEAQSFRAGMGNAWLESWPLILQPALSPEHTLFAVRVEGCTFAEETNHPNTRYSVQGARLQCVVGSHGRKLGNALKSPWKEMLLNSEGAQAKGGCAGGLRVL